MQHRCVFLFSDKSSGSTMIQTEFESQPTVQTLPVTPHHENETLFWIKASAALGLEQVDFTRSELPYSVEDGRQRLRDADGRRQRM